MASVPLVAEELAVIVPVPNAVLDDSSIDLWAQIRPELAAAFGRKIDRATLAGIDRPASFAPAIIPAATTATNTTPATGTAAQGGIAGDLGDAFTMVEADGYDVTGIAAHITHAETKQGIEQFYDATSITAEDIAQIIAFAVSRPRSVSINEILIRPTAQTL